jgi:hypothetical protein
MPECGFGKIKNLISKEIVMKKIVVTRRLDDYHACPEGHPEIWEAGVTSDEAISKLIRNNEEVFHIVVEQKG